MKVFFIALFLPFFVSCATNDVVTMSYSSVFKLSMPVSQLAGGTIFYSDELSVKSNNGQLVSAKIISRESEGLSPGFDLRLYPEYLLGVKKTDSLNSEVGKKFLNSRNEIDHMYGLKNLKIDRGSETAVYNLCRVDSCLAFLVKNNFDEHIFTVHSIGYSQSNFTKYLKGVVHVE